MLREAVVTLVLVAGALALAPVSPALPAACEPLAIAEETLQNDAGTGFDAPDTPAAPLRLGNDGNYSGYLSVVGHANADREDWYVYAVSEGTDEMLANITWDYPVLPLYMLDLPAYVQTFTLTLFPPDGSAPETVRANEPTLTIPDPLPGDYLVRVTATTVYESDACATPATGTIATGAPSPLRNHAMYLGCEPLCAAAAR